MYTLAQSLHMNTAMYLNSAAFCQLLIMTIVHLVKVHVKSFQYFEFVFIGCTKSSAIRYYNICVYCEYKNVIRMKDLYTPMKSNNI